MSKLTIDLERIQNSDGSYSEQELKVLSRATGKTIQELLNEAKGYSGDDIMKMTDEEWKENRSDIIKDAANS